MSSKELLLSIKDMYLMILIFFSKMPDAPTLIQFLVH